MATTTSSRKNKNIFLLIAIICSLGTGNKAFSHTGDLDINFVFQEIHLLLDEEEQVAHHEQSTDVFSSKQNKILSPKSLHKNTAITESSRVAYEIKKGGESHPTLDKMLADGYEIMAFDGEKGVPILDLGLQAANMISNFTGNGNISDKVLYHKELAGFVAVKVIKSKKKKKKVQILFTYAGTTNTADGLTDVLAIQDNQRTSVTGIGGSAHTGILNATTSSLFGSKDALRQILINKNLIPQNTTVEGLFTAMTSAQIFWDLIFTGHSLGGGEALIALPDIVHELILTSREEIEDSSFESVEIQRKWLSEIANISALVYAPPRVYDPVAASQLDALIGKNNVVIVKNVMDIIPRVPLVCMGYQHPGIEVIITPEFKPEMIADQHFITELATTIAAFKLAFTDPTLASGYALLSSIVKNATYLAKIPHSCDNYIDAMQNTKVYDDFHKQLKRKHITPPPEPFYLVDLLPKQTLTGQPDQISRPAIAMDIQEPIHVTEPIVLMKKKHEHSSSYLELFKKRIKKLLSWGKTKTSNKHNTYPTSAIQQPAEVEVY